MLEHHVAPDTRRAAPNRSDAGTLPGQHPMELWISYVLRVGVLIAGAIILVGLVLYIIQGPASSEPQSFNALTQGGGHSIDTSLTSIVRGVRDGHPTSIIELGVLALILTPITRVALTLALFLLQRDRVFSLITAAVLALLIVGLVGVGS
jgi:uncharacterized membrane protein